MRKQSRGIKKLVLSAMFMAIGLILPFITGQIQQIGSMLLPMHIPVLFCGLVCGWQYGMMVGFILPLLRYLLFGMPPIFPIGVSMTFELAAYGAVIGLIMQQLSKKSAAGKGKNYVLNLYVSLIGAMLAGRLVWGLVRFILTQVTMEPFTFEMRPGETMKIPTGIRVKIDEGWWLGCLPRSGLGFKFRMQFDNTMGVIDSDYYFSDNEGHIFAKITNDSKSQKIVHVEAGNGFMQAIFIPYGITYSDDATGVRNGGMGSTDSKA